MQHYFSSKSTRIIIILGILLLFTPFAFASIVDEVVEGVEDVVAKEVDRIESKIDNFVIAEIKKVETKLLIAYLVVIGINMIYSTILIFATKRFFSK